MQLRTKSSVASISVADRPENDLDWMLFGLCLAFRHESVLLSHIPVPWTQCTWKFHMLFALEGHDDIRFYGHRSLPDCISGHTELPARYLLFQLLARPDCNASRLCRRRSPGQGNQLVAILVLVSGNMMSMGCIIGD